MSDAIKPLDLLRAIFSKDSDMNQRERAFLAALLLHADNETGECYPSQATIAAEAGSNARSCQDVVRSLERRGLISRTARPKVNGRFPGTTYTIQPSAILALGNSHRRQDLPTVEDALGPSADSAGHRRQNLPTNCSDLTAQSELPNFAAPSAPAVKGGSSKAKRKKPEQATPEGHSETVAIYFAVFEQARGAKPAFGKREGKAISTLIEAVGDATSAQAVIGNAFADAWWATTKKGTILDLARGDYGKFVGGGPGDDGGDIESMLARIDATKHAVASRANGGGLMQAPAQRGQYDWTANLAANVKS